VLQPVPPEHLELRLPQGLEPSSLPIPFWKRFEYKLRIKSAVDWSFTGFTVPRRSLDQFRSPRATPLTASSPRHSGLGVIERLLARN
jgi:hypothetical protein